MADKRITDLDPIVTVQPGTLLVVVDNPTGTPTNKQATVSQLATVLTPAIPYPVASGGTGKTTLAAHGVLVGEGTTAVAVTTPGTAGQVLTSNGVAADPTFQAAVPSYDSGTWTPTLTGDGGGSGQTYAQQQGSYIKIGKCVTLFFYIQLSAKGTVTGNVVITGLPFPGTNLPVGAVLWSGLLTTWVSLVAAVNYPNIFILGATTPSTSNGGTLLSTDLSNTTMFRSTVTYFTP